ncbi:MAG: lysophospholipase [Acidimicrobiales bacterium]
MNESTFELEANEGQRLFAYRWLPETAPKAIVQVAHGASEHSARYRRLAEALTGAGFGAYAADHRGHGRTAVDFGRFGVARPGGWNAIVEDLHALTKHIAGEHPGSPIVLMGHSMGSMMAQEYLQRWSSELAGVVLSGTTGGSVLDETMLSAIVAMGEGEAADEPSEVFAGMFAGFNEPFSGPDATGFEWLSRDAAEVQLYVDDPWCGEPLSNGFVADMMSGMQQTWTGGGEASIATDLPAYVFSGEQDPVGGTKADSVRELVARYEELGIGPVTLRLYPDGRHEMLNETNRAVVETDLVSWLDALLP